MSNEMIVIQKCVFQNYCYFQRSSMNNRLIDGMKRGCIYFFYDSLGIVDDYIVYLLDDLAQNIDELVIVCNGKLSEEGRRKFEKYHCRIIVRPNEGLDVWAYKAGISSMGWDKIETFDELVMLNHTIMGPVYPFSETFEKMKNRDVDFWGITKHKMLKKDPYGINPYGFLPEHIQSHFMVYRKKLLCSKEFQKYWNEFREIKNYRDSVGYHESYFTKYFSDLGFKWEVSVDVTDLEDMSDYPGFYCARDMVERKRCPIFKRRSFLHDYGQLLETTTGQAVYELFKFLEESKLYDTELIWQNILRTMDHTDIAKNLQLNYTLPLYVELKKEVNSDINSRRVALLIHIYYTEELEKLKKYICNMPSCADIYITTQTEEKKEYIEANCDDLPNKVVVKIVENRGRDVSALMMVGKELVKKYDYICFIHDKKVTQEKPGSVGEAFAYICYENVLGSRTYVKNVLQLFENNRHLGVVCPPKPLHGPYVFGLMETWEKNYYNVVKLLEKLDIEVPIDKYKVPIAPHGSCFWFRSNALQKLFEYDWKYDDFPEEPLPIDGTISHAIERIYAYIAQDSGYYSSVVMNDEYVRIEYTTLMYYAMHYGNLSMLKYLEGEKKINYRGWDYRIKYFLRKILPKQVFVKVINTKRKLMGPHKIYRYEDN